MWQFHYFLKELIFLPTDNEGSFISTSSPTFVLSNLFDIGYSHQCELISHCSFNSHFPNNKWCWAFYFSYVCGPSVCLLWRRMYSGILPIFRLGYFYCWVVWVLYIFWISTLSQMYDMQIFSQLLGCLFVFAIVYLAVKKLFNLM